MAFEDLNDAHSRIRRDNPSAAQRFAAKVRREVARLREHPELGSLHPDLLPYGRYRYLVVAPYVVIYRLEGDDAVLLLRVWDARQDPDQLAVSSVN